VLIILILCTGRDVSVIKSILSVASEDLMMLRSLICIVGWGGGVIASCVWGTRIMGTDTLGLLSLVGETSGSGEARAGASSSLSLGGETLAGLVFMARVIMRDGVLGATAGLLVITCVASIVLVEWNKNLGEGAKAEEEERGWGSSLDLTSWMSYALQMVWIPIVQLV
jgi:hypothetical protein